jgi:hypothetical protein
MPRPPATANPRQPAQRSAPDDAPAPRPAAIVPSATTDRRQPPRPAAAQRSLRSVPSRCAWLLRAQRPQRGAIVERPFLPRQRLSALFCHARECLSPRGDLPVSLRGGIRVPAQTIIVDLRRSASAVRGLPGLADRRRLTPRRGEGRFPPHSIASPGAPVGAALSALDGLHDARVPGPQATAAWAAPPMRTGVPSPAAGSLCASGSLST